MIRVGIDIGGTFTDFVVFDPENERITTFKLPSDAANPAYTVIEGLKKIDANLPIQVIHGSTVATNALLEHKGARTALVTTQGFKDVLQIARQNRPSLYDWTVKPPAPLVPTELRLEVDERVDYQGMVQKPINLVQAGELVRSLIEKKVESVAICFLFSFLYPQHEQRVAELLRNTGLSVSASSEILPEFREYERTSTTVVNAYVSPILDRYLTKLESAMPHTHIQVMQSNGGMISIKEARQNGARCILSGPAGGIVGAQNIARTIISGMDGFINPAIKLVTFDMGGTSADVSLIDEQPSVTTEASFGGCPIHLPLLDIHTIGAGGGSIAYVDPGGSLRVGPQSAGADPGPACYGKGELPTVTDANLVLGRLLPDHFLGGKMSIDPARSALALSSLGKSLGMPALQAAQGVIEVVNAQMEHALRVISVERGHDPRLFSLFSFGGAGGLHAVELASRMGIPRVIISKYAATLSAYGMLASNVTKDYVKTVMLPGETSLSMLEDLFIQLIAQGKREILGEEVPAEMIELQESIDIRFSGQSYELNVPYSAHFLADFHHAHRQAYGYTYEDKPVEIVNLRVKAVGRIKPISLPRVDRGHNVTSPVPFTSKLVEFISGTLELPVFEYESLYPGIKFHGPALIVSPDTTILIGINDTVVVDPYQNLLIDVGKNGYTRQI